MRAILWKLRWPAALALALALAISAAAPSAIAAEPPPTDCDRLAAHVDDPQRVPGVVGVFGERQIDGPVATAACRDALARYPDTPRFQFQLGRALLAESFRGYDGDCTQALPLLEAAYRGGHAQAATTIARCHSAGWGVPKDAGKAAEWHREAARLGSTTSTALLAKQIGYGQLGYRKNEREAIRILVEMAERGDTTALFELSDHLRHGWWAKKDEKLSFELLLTAARRGNVSAMYWAGHFYHGGVKGAPKDLEKAREILQRAVAAGHEMAPRELAEVEAELALVGAGRPGLPRQPGQPGQPASRMPHGKRVK